MQVYNVRKIHFQTNLCRVLFCLFSKGYNSLSFKAFCHTQCSTCNIFLIFWHRMTSMQVKEKHICYLNKWKDSNSHLYLACKNTMIVSWIMLGWLYEAFLMHLEHCKPKHQRLVWFYVKRATNEQHSTRIF